MTPHIVYVPKNSEPQHEYDLIKAAASQSSPHIDTSERRSSTSEPRSFKFEGHSPYTETIEQTASPGTRYVQHVSLPKSMPNDATYMYSAVHPSEMEDNEVTDLPPRKIMPGMLYEGMEDTYLDSAENTGYETAALMNHGGKKIIYLTENMKNGAGMEGTSKSDYFNDEPSYVERDSHYSADTSSARPGLGKFFGLTGTTSQNIQVRK